ncbi:F0F1 ATP synthase subunit A [Nocardioidaceae bacterium SCSIO 66511]|nr:F0F1 ATP synthase subunit A [Nocardioidaceae bacterium SCSIO 66511]
MTTASNTVLAEGFQAPGPGAFELPPVFGDVTKPMMLLVLSAILVFGFFWLASRRAAVVPSKLQFVGEYAYNFTRNSITRDSIGSEHFRKFVPYITALFFFVLINNLYGLLPFLQFPSFSRASFAYGLAALTWLLYNGAGIAKHGVGGYFKLQTIPGGVKGPILGLIIPLEFFSNILVRPFTLCLRLFANMFAGHLLLMLFVLGGEYLIFDASSALYAPVGVLSLLMALAVSFLELLVMFLQAYVFALLTAMYVGGAIADEH